jgi:PKD repeat protein
VGQAPLTVRFDGSGSTAINGTISAYLWSFGDNQTAPGPIVSHTYTTPGVYAASLFIGDGTTVTITVTPPPLVAPSDLSATALRKRVSLTWTNPVSSATALELERCKGRGCTSFAPIAALSPSATSFLDSTVRKGTTYRYRLAASDSTGTVFSNIATAGDS